MKIAIVNSNNIKILRDAKKGTEIFVHILLKQLVRHIEKNKFEVIAFASGDSELPVPIESVNYLASSLDNDVPDKKHIIFELALLSKAFERQKEFDLFHINIGDGDIALPFAPFVKKPILITLHNTGHSVYVDRYFSLFKNIPNIFFVSISDAQRKFFPDLNFIKTIYHGIDTVNNFLFDEQGGENIMWAGRGIPKKGMDIVIQISRSLNKETKLFPMVKKSHESWFEDEMNKIMHCPKIIVEQDADRLKLLPHYQSSKLFLFPLQWEEPFGLVVIEALGCGTPVIAFARGAMPEIIKDGETGFLVNPSPDDIRGDWIIKKTGIEGLKEAVEKIYSLPPQQYKQIRRNCRKHVEENFAAERMASEYVDTYKKIVKAS